jgi:hypothetical protein
MRAFVIFTAGVAFAYAQCEAVVCAPSEYFAETCPSSKCDVGLSQLLHVHCFRRHRYELRCNVGPFGSASYGFRFRIFDFSVSFRSHPWYCQCVSPACAMIRPKTSCLRKT